MQGVLDQVDDAIDVRSLPAGTVLIVRTRNSRYRVVTLPGPCGSAWIEGGRHFPAGAEVRITGSTSGGSLLVIDRVCRGLCLEMSAEGRQLRTSRVRSIEVETPAQS